MSERTDQGQGGGGGGGGGGIEPYTEEGKRLEREKMKSNKSTGKDEKIGFMLESRLNKHSFTGTSSNRLVG